jgi:hypothetical protein
MLIQNSQQTVINILTIKLSLDIYEHLHSFFKGRDTDPSQHYQEHTSNSWLKSLLTFFRLIQDYFSA